MDEKVVNSVSPEEIAATIEGAVDEFIRNEGSPNQIRIRVRSILVKNLEQLIQAALGVELSYTHMRFADSSRLRELLLERVQQQTEGGLRDLVADLEMPPINTDSFQEKLTQIYVKEFKDAALKIVEDKAKADADALMSKFGGNLRILKETLDQVRKNLPDAPKPAIRTRDFGEQPIIADAKVMQIVSVLPNGELTDAPDNPDSGDVRFILRITDRAYGRTAFIAVNGDVWQPVAPKFERHWCLAGAVLVEEFSVRNRIFDLMSPADLKVIQKAINEFTHKPHEAPHE